ncbi:MAG: hypothetical protein KDA79_14395 [Planctomycetaceae bacterium]|nr:hypothetical protein [Planctomycetaceae bacterium]
MASSSGKPTAVHFALIFFVMLSVITSVVAYMMYGSYETASANADKAVKERDAQKSAWQQAYDEVGALKKLVGHEHENVGAGTNDPNTVHGAAQADFQRFGGAVAGGVANYSTLLQRLRTELDNVTTERDALQADLNDHKTRILALEGQYEARVAEFQQRTGSAETDLRSVVTDKEEAVASKDTRIRELENALSQVRLELSQEREASAVTLKEKNREIDGLVSINDLIREKLEQATMTSFEVEDGELRWVDHNAGLIWINLGSADKLPKRATFSVYNKGHHGVGRGPEDIKGSIEVTRVIGPHLSEARILTDDIYQPMAPGDPIYTPLWSPGRSEAFSIIGLIDLDGDKKSDRPQFHDLVAAAGATIDNEVDENGNRTGDGIAHRTKFLIVAEIPDPSQVAHNDRPAAEKISREFSALRKEARLQGVRIISLSDFLAHIGYKPQQRIWRPGEEIPWKLKAGSQSTSVNQTLGNRESSGQTSGAYSRSKRLRQPTSSGQTSKVFNPSSGY